MIVYTRDDTVKLSGALVRNQWQTIKAAANLLLREHGEGILIDGGELTHVTEEGARTFLDAMKDIQSAGARMVVCNLPEHVMEVLRTVPGVRSQLALAMSVEDARASLKPDREGTHGFAERSVVVPLIDGLDTETAMALAARAGRERSAQVTALAFIVVARQVAIGTPAPDLEARAQESADEALREARRLGITCTVHLARVRDVRDGLLAELAAHHAVKVVVALRAEMLEEEGLLDLANELLRKAPCDVLLARAAAPVAESQPSGNGGSKTR